MLGNTVCIYSAAIFNNHNHNHARAVEGIGNEKRTFCAFVALLCNVVKAAALLLLQLKYKLAFRVQIRQSLEDGERREGWEEDEEKERNGCSQTTSCRSFYYTILKKRKRVIPFLKASVLFCL